MSEEPVIVGGYSDGGCIGANPSAVGGMWAWCLVDAVGRRVKTGSGVILPATYDLAKVSNNLSEFVAFGRMLRALPEGWSGRVYTDSKCTLDRFFHGATLNGIPFLLASQIPVLRARLGDLEPVLLAGHPNREARCLGVNKAGKPVSVHNAWCDEECNRVAEAHLRSLRLTEWRQAAAQSISAAE